MKRAWTSPWLAGAGVVLLILGPGLEADAQQKNQLVSRKVTAAPATDGSLDAAWSAAPPLTVRAVGGKSFPGGATEISLRSVTTSDTIYVYLQYKDATQSLRRSPWQKQADGSWKKLTDPVDKGGDNNLYYEDKVALIWNISSPAFEQRGCTAACHTGEGKPYGNKYLPSADERADMWHLKGVRTAVIGQVDDQYLDGTRYDKDTAKEAGRKSDPKTGGGYVDNVSDDKTMPKFGLPGNKPAPPYWIVEQDKEPFDDAKYKAGDEVPGIRVAPFTGDRGDISATVSWKDGVYTIVMWRKLVTGSAYDVQFNDARKPYAFGVAVFDNAQVRHAYVPGVLKLVFE